MTDMRDPQTYLHIFPYESASSNLDNFSTLEVVRPCGRHNNQVSQHSNCKYLLVSLHLREALFLTVMLSATNQPWNMYDCTLIMFHAVETIKHPRQKTFNICGFGAIG
jgi:hypothetical protein